MLTGICTVILWLSCFIIITAQSVAVYEPVKNPQLNIDRDSAIKFRVLTGGKNIILCEVSLYWSPYHIVGNF